MPNYIRAFAPGGTFFFTVNLLERRRTLLTDHIEALRAAFSFVRNQKPYVTRAYVILPDHLHCIWSLPDGDADFSSRWQQIKAHFARHIPKGERLSGRRLMKGERGVWQRRFWEHMILETAVDRLSCDQSPDGLILFYATNGHRFGESATGRIARFWPRRSALQLLAIH